MANDPKDRFRGEPKIQFAVDYDFPSLAYRLLAFREKQGGIVEVFETVATQVPPNPMERIRPTFTFRHLEDMQPLMNALWELGVRPNAYTLTNEHFDSVKAHLDDMKRLVEKAYKVEFGNGKKD